MISLREESSRMAPSGSLLVIKILARADSMQEGKGEAGSQVLLS